MEEILFTIKRDQVILGEYCTKEIYSLAATGFLKPDDLIRKKDGKWFLLKHAKNINFPNETEKKYEFSDQKIVHDILAPLEKKQQIITKFVFTSFSLTSVVILAVYFICKYQMGISQKEGDSFNSSGNSDYVVSKEDSIFFNKAGNIFGDIVEKISIAKDEIAKNEANKINENEKQQFEKVAKKEVIEEFKNNIAAIQKPIIDINQELVKRGFKNQNEGNYVHKGHMVDFLRFGNSNAKKLYKANKVKAIESGLELQNTLGDFNFNLSGKGAVGYLPKDGNHYLRLQLPFCVLGQDFSEKKCLTGIIESGWVEEFNKGRPACLYDNGKVRVFDWLTWGGLGSEKKFINESERSGGHIYYSEDVSTIVFRLNSVGVPKGKESEYFNFLHKNITYRVVFGNLQAIPFDSSIYFSKKSLDEFNGDCYRIRNSNSSGLDLVSRNPDIIEVKIENQKDDRPDLYIRPSADVLAVGLYVNGKEIGVYKK